MVKNEFKQTVTCVNEWTLNNIISIQVVKCSTSCFKDKSFECILVRLRASTVLSWEHWSFSEFFTSSLSTWRKIVPKISCQGKFSFRYCSVVLKTLWHRVTLSSSSSSKHLRWINFRENLYNEEIMNLMYVNNRVVPLCKTSWNLKRFLSCYCSL